MSVYKFCLATAAATFLLLAMPCSPANATTYFEVKKKCPVGGEKFKAYDVGSSSSWGQRPDGRNFGTLPIWPLIVCPKNGFVIFDEEFTKDELLKLNEAVSSAEYQAMIQRDEARHYKAWWLATKIDRPLRQRAGLLMQASWDSDDLPERKQRYQREFANLTEQLDLQDAAEGDNFWLSLRGANALRELGEFERAAARIANLKSAKNYPMDEEQKKGADWLIEGLSRLIDDKNSFSEPTNLIPRQMAETRCKAVDLLLGVELEACQKIATGVPDEEGKGEQADEDGIAAAAGAAEVAAEAAKEAAREAMKAAREAEKAARKAKQKKPS